MDRTAMAIARMIISETLTEIAKPQPWRAANDARRPTSGKNRAKVKAARKQNRSKK